VRRTDTKLATRSQPGLLHEAAVVGGDDDFLAHVAPFIRAGCDEGPTLAVLSRRHWALLGPELGAAGEQVSFADCNDFYTRPIDAIASYDTALRRLSAQGHASVRVVGEIPLGPTRAGWDDWISYEAILNRAFADRPAHVLCVYDSRTAPDPVLDAVWRTHPHVVAGDGITGPHYHEPDDVVSAIARVPTRELHLPTLPLIHDTSAFREALSAELAGAGAPETKVVNMLVAASEVFQNALQHGNGPTALRAGLVDGWFVCEIEDRGPGIDDPLAGYLPPTPGQPGREGLWIARQLVSRLELIPAQPGLTARLWL
jgi:anti-sigma regulatory factor (Ser/Thr protein kinase)